MLKHAKISVTYLSRVLDKHRRGQSAFELRSVAEPSDHSCETTSDNTSHHAWNKLNLSLNFIALYHLIIPEAVALAHRIERAMGITLEAMRMPVK